MGRWFAFSLAAAVGLSLGAAPPAAADRLDVAGEVRADGSASFGSVGQFGTLGGSGPCGANPTTDGGGDVIQPITVTNESGWVMVTLNDITVTTGSCTVGVFSEGTAGAWANFDPNDISETHFTLDVAAGSKPDDDREIPF